MPAQQSRATLDQVEKLMQADRLQEARATLQLWQKQHTRSARKDDDTWRMTYLAARLSSDAHDAEEQYLTLAISAPPSNRYVPEALLRVGQAEIAAGSTRNAIPYFRRLIENYPKNEYATVAAEWLQRAQTAQAAQSPAPNGAVIDAAPAAQQQNWTVQVAAFHELSGARSVAQQVQAKGFADVRIARVPDNTLVRVRVGHFASAADGTGVVEKLKHAGFSAVLVSDAAHEISVQ